MGAENTMINNQKKQGPRNQHQRGAKHGVKRFWLLLLFIAIALTVTVLIAATRRTGLVSSTAGAFTVRRDNLVVTVQVAGSIRAHKSIQYKCQVERGRDIGEVSILNIVPAGTYVTQEDVDKDMVLVELDSSALKDRLTQEKTELAGDQENAVAAKEAYEIQLIENESNIARSELEVRFALLDLQKYLGAILAEKLTKDVNDAVNLSDYIAPFVMEVEKDPNMLSGTKSWQEMKDFQDQIVLAQGDLKTAQDTYAGTLKLHDANYVSDLELERDRLSVINRQFRAQSSEVDLDLFIRYDFPKNAEQFLSNYIEAGRSLQRTYAQCRSREAQAKVRLSTAEQRLQEQVERVKEFEQQIAYCIIKAKAPGLVVYGTGGEEDIFRAMRGRGVSSGIIAEGETVSEGQVLISMPDTASMVAEISVHETEVDKIRPGQFAIIVMDAFPDKQLRGKVLEVAPLPDQQRGWMNPDLKVYKTLVSIDGTHSFLRSRMSCKVEMLVEQLSDVITVPITAVANRGGRKVCYVVTSQGTEEERVVQTGVFNDTSAQILEGLEVGEEVLLNPPLLTESSAEAFQQPLPELISEQGQVDGVDMGTQTRRDDQGVREAGQSQEGGRGEGMRGMPRLTEEQIKQFKEKFGGQGEGGMPPLTEEQMKQFKEKFGSQGGGMPGMTEEQMRQFKEKFGSGRSGRGTGRRNRSEQSTQSTEEKSAEE